MIISMPLGAAVWNAKRSFYDGLSLAQDGFPPEQEFAGRRELATAFPHYERFWKWHVCPATTRPDGMSFRPATSGIVRKAALTSYAILNKLLDADDSLAKVQAGDLGHRHRNAREAIEAAGNALQLATELQFTLVHLARQLGVPIDPFPDWKTNWAANRDAATKYRHFLIHEGVLFTVTVEGWGEILVLGRDSFRLGISSEDLEAWYTEKPADWQPLSTVCKDVIGDTVAFIDLTYERLVNSMKPLLLNSAYQQAWGWTDSTMPVSRPPSTAAHSAPAAGAPVTRVLQAGSASITVQHFGITNNKDDGPLVTS